MLDPVPLVRPVEVDPWLLEMVLSWWAKLAAFVWGALWGSFANVVIHRVPRGLSVVRPRSRCPECHAEIAAWDNIPVLSYLILRGRCRQCGKSFSARYVIVELLCGVLSFALYLQCIVVPLVEGGGVEWLTYAASLLFALALVVVIYIDVDCWTIPDEVVLPVAVVGFVVAAAAPASLGVGIVEALAAAAGAFIVFAGIRAFYLRFRDIEALGLGDAKLLVMVAAFIGARGVLWTVFAGAVQGILVAVPMLLLGRKLANTELEEVHGDDPGLGHEDPAAGVMGRRVPFGPFLAVAALEYVFVRGPIESLFGFVFAP